MLPTLASSGDLLIQDNISHRLSPPRIARGDLVVCLAPSDPSKSICKRVLGLPGDIICVDPRERNSPHVSIPKGHLWLQGDNYENSTDSRVYGPVPMGLVRGKVFGRVRSFETLMGFISLTRRIGLGVAKPHDI